ncbi:MAG: hypothetical protein AAF203_01890 [Pseudomonadota bacterium]
MKQIIILIGFLFLLGACQSSEDSVGPTPSNPESGQDVGGDPVGDTDGETDMDANCIPKDMPVVVYQDIQDQVMSVSCTFCHSDRGGNPAGINLENFANVFQNRIRVQDSIQAGRMPRPPGQITNDQINLFAAWLNLGAPETIEDLNLCD